MPKAWFVILVILVALWWEHQRRQKRQVRRQQRPIGVVNTQGRGVRTATQFSSTGGVSPGSGVMMRQPAMKSSWGIGGGQIIGLTGPSYAARGAR